ASEGVIMVFSATPLKEAHIYAELQIHSYPVPQQPRGIFVDQDYHHYAMCRSASAPLWATDQPPICLQELRLGVADISKSIYFYRETLGLALLEQDERSASFATGNVKIVLQDWCLLTGKPPNRPNGALIVFHTEDILQTYAALSKNGLKFNSEIVNS